MNNAIKVLLTRLELEENGRYDNQFYVINLEDSNEYARMYTKLSKKAINTDDVKNFNLTDGLTQKELERIDKNKDKIVIIVTHNKAIADVADRVLKIVDGKIVSDITQKKPKKIEDIEF